MAIHLFIDTNVYLKFYHFSSDDLEQLSRLMMLLENDVVELYVPIQVINEFERNRDNKLADAIKTLRNTKLDFQFPEFCKEYKEYEILRKKIKECEEEKNRLLKNIMLAIDSQSLKADNVITSLFERSNTINLTSELIEVSKIRFDLGNPPGKNKSYGDAINWESLLSEVPQNMDLYFITDDKDYYSEIDNTKFNDFLRKEWLTKKNSNIKFYKTLSEFFKSNFPDIKLEAELEKEILVNQLFESKNFFNSRKYLTKLSRFDKFSTEQINNILKASINNFQINYIGSDYDINEYLYDIIEKNKENIDSDLLEKFELKIPRRIQD
ncbi:MAG: PIN domain-containing protein [Sediminibacterium sp.]|nr:PIN domain-containing protein [Sediminibacterium sp.]